MENQKLESVLEGCKNNNLKCQNYLYGNYVHIVKSVAYKYYRDKHIVNDIVQESFIKIFNSLHKYDNKGSFEGWIKKIVRNLIVDGFRKKKIDFTYDDKFDTYYTSIEDVKTYDYSYDEKISDIIDESNKLSHSYGLVFKLYYIEGLSHKDISTELGINEGTSKSNLHKAKKNIYQKLKNKVY